MRRFLATAAALTIGAVAPRSFAQVSGAEPTPAPTPEPAPAPYSLPWQLRPAIPVNVVRNDLVLAFYQDPTSKKGGFIGVESILVSVKLAPWVALAARGTVIGNAPPAPGAGAGSVANPVIAALFGWKHGDLRFAPSFSVALPVGMGGGDKPDVGADAANKTAVRARSAMDNAVFATNYLTLIAGLDLAWIHGGFTVQAEATLLGLMRVRGASASPDPATVNLTLGLHAGYFFIPQLSLGAELRHQRFVTTPKMVAADEALQGDAALGLRDTTTFAVGPRLHFKLGASTWIRPGVAYARGVDRPLSKAAFNIVQLDVPVVF